MTGAWTIVLYGLREAIRRRIFLVVLLLTVAFLVLYRLGAGQVVEETRAFAGTVDLETEVLTGGTLLGLAMFATLFLGVVLAIFLTIGVVRGDAEHGLLQPLVVRPLGRPVLLLARFAGAATVAAVYSIAVFAAAAALTSDAGAWVPESLTRPALQLAAAVVVLAALSLLGSVFLTSTANGIAVFMVFGAGLVAGLLGQIGEVVDSQKLLSVSRWASWALPFEALYQDALHQLTAEVRGLERLALQLGPFGGSQPAGDRLWPWAIAYVAGVLGAAVFAFSRRDL